jgi:acyl-CoA dehydrogenase
MKPTRSPWENEEHEMLRDGAARYIESEFVPELERWIGQGIVDREAWNKAGEAGLLCASVPEEYGGPGGTYAHEAVIIEEMEYSGIGLNFATVVHNTIVAHYILAYGTEEQKLRWLPKMVTGEIVGAIAMTEPGTGSDLQAVKATAEKDGDDWIINGQKTFISNGQLCDLVIVVCKTSRDKGAKGLSLLVVECDSDGFSRGQNLSKIGVKASDTSEIFFDNVHVPASNLLGEEGKGFVQLMQQLPQERLGLSVQAVAAMERAIALTSDYVKERKVFGAPLLSLQNTRFVLAECKTEATIARIFIDECIQRHMRGELDNETVAMSKWWCTERQNVIVSKCLQLFGGYGYSTEYPISRMFTDARVQMIYGGANEVMKEIIGRGI